MIIWIAIAAGGAAGAMSRYATTLIVAAAMGPGWQPLATLSVNIAGSALMGLISGGISTGALSLSETARLLVQVGFLGAVTTFSSFALDVVGLLEKGQAGLAAGYVVASVLLSLAAFVLMLGLMRMMAGGA